MMDSSPDASELRDDASDEANALDIALMRRAQQGDMSAFERLVELHQNRVVGTIAKMLGDESEAEDVAQQVFIRVWKSAERYEPTAKFTTWLYKITRNLVFNELRRRRRHPAVPIEHEQDPEPRHADPGAQSPAASLMDEELQQAIQKAIDSLPETQRMAIVLRRYEELSYEEIGEVLKLSVPAVKSVLFRARAELKERLKRYLE